VEPKPPTDPIRGRQLPTSPDSFASAGPRFAVCRRRANPREVERSKEHRPPASFDTRSCSERDDTGNLRDDISNQVVTQRTQVRRARGSGARDVPRARVSDSGGFHAWIGGTAADGVAAADLRRVAASRLRSVRDHDPSGFELREKRRAERASGRRACALGEAQATSRRQAGGWNNPLKDSFELPRETASEASYRKARLRARGGAGDFTSTSRGLEQPPEVQFRRSPTSRGGGPPTVVGSRRALGQRCAARRSRVIFACSRAAVRSSVAVSRGRRARRRASISSALLPVAQTRKTKPCFVS